MYKLNKKIKSLAGSSLIKALPDFSNDDIEKIFGRGTAKRAQDKSQYSDTLVVVSDITDEVFTLYKAYGEWRIGGISSRIPPTPMYPRELWGFRSREPQRFEQWLRAAAGKDQPSE